MLFFGGLAVAVQASRRRRARMQAALLAAELRRASAQRGLADARLAALRMQVAPDFLLDTLTRLVGLYETGPVAADLLLDKLIEFLRRALAGIRAAQGNPDDTSSAAFAPKAWNVAP